VPPIAKRWPTETKLRALYRAGYTYDEIAEVIEINTGWKPSRAAVGRKREELGEPPRRLSHVTLIPWHVLPRHHDDRFRHMLTSESRRRTGISLSRPERAETEMLRNILFGRGVMFVVCYRTDIGFHLAERYQTDTDIVRVSSVGPQEDDVGNCNVLEEVN